MLKVSGEALQGKNGFGVDPEVLRSLQCITAALPPLYAAFGRPSVTQYPIRPLQVLRSVAAEIAAASREGVEVAVVVGGGNFFRGINAWDGLERATADYMGMLATCTLSAFRCPR